MRITVAAAAIAGVACAGVTVATAQESQPAAGRAALVEEAQAKKSTDLRPFQPDKVEHILNRLEKTLLTGGLKVHPFFDSAYAGGGFTLGAGYLTHVSSYNTLDLRGSYTLSGYKRIEAAFVAPRLFDRRGMVTLIGGWREAMAVGYYGIGTEGTSQDDRAK